MRFVLANGRTLCPQTFCMLARANSTRVPDAVQRPSRCSAEPGPGSTPARWAPGSAAHRHSASKTRVNALMALRSIRGTGPHYSSSLRGATCPP
jgi:hypothetical protein